MTKATAACTLGNALGNQPADKRVEILRLIGESGSISQAARDASVSYKAAWQAIDTLTNLAGVVLVERAVGGSGGGGASLTPAGKTLLSMSRLISEARNQVFLSFQSNELLPRSIPMLSGMSVRTSMRNQMPCIVEKLDIRGQVVRVHLRLAEGEILVSRITKTSAELLDLKKKQPVLALFKATAVGVAAYSTAAANGALPALQALCGRAVRISRGAAGDEVSLKLDSGLQLVGFAAPDSKLKSGASVRAQVEESAIVIALAG